MRSACSLSILLIGCSVAAACSSSDDTGGSAPSTTSGDSTGSGGASSGSGGAGESSTTGTMATTGATGSQTGGPTSGAGGFGSGSGGAGGSVASTDTWDSFAKDFFASYCVECHGAGDTSRDYTTLADVTADKDEIRCGVASIELDGCGSFPPPEQFPIGNGAKPDDEARARLVAWIEAGLPE